MKELQELFDLYEAEMNSVQSKPDLQDAIPSSYEGPNKGNFEHPVTQQRNEVDYMRAQGMDAVQAHQSVHGEINTSDVEAKASLASTLGRVQDDNDTQQIRLDPEKRSILSRDADYEKNKDQVTRDDLRTPMNQQVPDAEQTPVDQVAEEVYTEPEIDYNDDVAYLQKFGRA